ncbi:GlsB/YeaQ/YmgE family stress response membrane protein [Ochrovirga pacifica]|uniref:GlsB/YeaQ/YmgE family stress response membrane protein n=1 Tax=Ochrovirga pacifica TaxID=1042376 RepID=UPI0002559854|nr:GlsB/YeaQ/YmgE family stress response membrane protein [Ochrovirga pacifica]
MDFLIDLAIAAAAGWAASFLFKKDQFGFLGYLAIGIIGGFIGQFTFKYFRINIIGGFFGQFLYALAGALLLLFVMSLFRGKSKK